MNIIDTHCHIHDPEFARKYKKPVEQIVDEAKAAGVFPFVSVGTDGESSRIAVQFAKQHGTYASLALHPHEVSEKPADKIDEEFALLASIAAENHKEVVAIGECGLDYFYHKEKEVQAAQQALFRRHLDLARKHDLPLIFHIRDAFEDFFAIIDEYNKTGPAIRGVVHSFTAFTEQLEECVKRGLYVGVNGIMTFTKIEAQLAAAQAIPREYLVLETDAPFLTPAPFRGNMCELYHIVETAKFLAALRKEPLEELAAYTTDNAKKLFSL